MALFRKPVEIIIILLPTKQFLLIVKDYHVRNEMLARTCGNMPWFVFATRAHELDTSINDSLSTFALNNQ